jgi:enamine deaminase RidA (YjgF/YER057c/UK114 family)
MTVHDRDPELLQPAGWPAPKGYAHGMAASGRIVVTGGLVGWDERELFAEGFVAQARQIFLNLRAVLAAAGAAPRHLVRLTWYVVDVDEYLAARRELGAAYREVLGRHFPAMAVVGVTRLVEPAARLEIEATAVIPEGEPAG